MSSPTPIAPAPDPADVGIVAALPIEVAPLKAALHEVRTYAVGRRRIVEGELSGKLVALMVTGPGRASARRGAELLLAGHRPHWLLSVGFAGALEPGLERHGLVLPGEVVDPEGRRFTVDVQLADGPSCHGGRLATVDHIVRTAADKASLREQTGARFVDMETSAVVELCAARSVRFLGVRVISDVADEDLPPEILSILGPSGSYRIGAAAGAIWRRPGSLKDLWALREHAVEAARRLGAALPGVLARL